MRQIFYAIALSTLLLTVGCGDDSQLDPNAPIAGQPAAGGNGWTSENIRSASEICAAYGKLNQKNTALNSWISFCQCGYAAISTAEQCTYDNFSSSNDWANYCIGQKQTEVNGCMQSAGLSQGQKELAQR